MTFRGYACDSESSFVSARLTGVRWRTARGLRAGQTIQELRDLYPEASRAPSGRWILLRRNKTPTLQVESVAGRVTALVVRPFRFMHRW